MLGTPAGAAAPGTNVAAEPVRQTRHAHIPAPMVLDFVRRPAVEALPSAVPSRKQQKAAGETPAAQLKKRIIDKKGHAQGCPRRGELIFGEQLQRSGTAKALLPP